MLMQKTSAISIWLQCSKNIYKYTYLLSNVININICLGKKLAFEN